MISSGSHPKGSCMIHRPGHVAAPTIVLILLACAGMTQATRADGAVYGWGWNNLGQAGDGAYVIPYTPMPISALPDGITAVATGGAHSLAIRNGALYSWGSNFIGALGDP